MKKIKNDYIFFITCLYLLVFQNILQDYIKVFKYFDEILALLVIPFVLIEAIKNRTQKTIKKNNLIIIVSLIALCITGLYSNLEYNIQPFNIYISDLIVVLKFFLVYYLSYIMWPKSFYLKQKEKIFFHIKIITIMLLILSIGNYIFDLFPGEFRLGIKTNQLYYSHPTYLAAVCIFLLALCIRCSEKIISIYSVINIIILISTLRFKAIGSAIAAIIMAIYIDKSNKNLSISKLGLIGLVLLIVAYDQISFYFLENNGYARQELTEKSLEIAKDYFPVGTGFGTYGSYYSTVEYSPVYYTYKLSNIYGLQKKYSIFASDSFWPMIIGQFGYLGTIIYIYILCIVFKMIQTEFNKKNKYNYISKIICIAYLLISSTAESAFVNPLAIPLAILIGTKKDKDEINENINNCANI